MEDGLLARCTKNNNIHNYLSCYISKHHKKIFQDAPKGRNYVVATIYQEDNSGKVKPILHYFANKSEVFQILRKEPSAAFDYRDTPNIELMY
jgi:hypothetical protein